MFDESLSDQQTNSLQYETQVSGIDYGCFYTRKSFLYSENVMTVELCLYYCNKFGFTYAALYGYIYQIFILYGDSLYHTRPHLKGGRV